MHEKNTSYTIKSVENALCILDAISEEGRDFSISTLSHKLGMARSYIFRMLATFEKCGYVQQDRPNGQYRAGLSAYQTGGRFLRQQLLVQQARPLMETLARDCNEAIYLVVPGKTDVLFLDLVESKHQVQVKSLVGNIYPLESCSAGQVIKSFRDEPYSLTAQLKKIRRQEYCFDRGILEEGVASVSVPIFSSKEQVACCFCLVAPVFRLNKKIVEQTYLPLMENASQSVSIKQGYYRQSVGRSGVLSAYL